MALTGPQKYPGANTSHWYQSQWGGDSMESNVIVWHTTEGTNLDGYNNGAVAPNFTAKPNFAVKKIEWYQHFDFDVSARALVHAGAVATNTMNVCQIELVATCDPATHKRWASQGIQHLYSPELPDWVVRDLAAFSRWAHDNHGVPLTSGVRFESYPESYGTGNGVRMTNDQWLAFKGHCGHQHVPSGNVHGDPGAFPMGKILDAAKAGGTDAPVKPSVSLVHIVAAAKKDPGAAQGHTTYKAEVLLVERALAAEKLLSSSYADGSYGTKTVNAYAAWQRKCGVGGPYDGVPGKTSLSRLGKAHGFTVKE